MDSNSAVKLPSPKPSLPLRWMISKKIGPMLVSVKICSSSFFLVSGSASIRMRFLRHPREVLAVVRDALVDHVVVGVRRVQEVTPCARIASTVA
jgi:hypothetical protein